MQNLTFLQQLLNIPRGFGELLHVPSTYRQLQAPAWCRPLISVGRSGSAAADQQARALSPRRELHQQGGLADGPGALQLPAAPLPKDLEAEAFGRCRRAAALPKCTTGPTLKLGSKATPEHRSHQESPLDLIYHNINIFIELHWFQSL